MKNKLLFLFVIVLLSGSVFKTFAYEWDECPPGYTYNVTYGTYNGCSYIAGYCCYWDNTTARLHIQWKWLTPPDGWFCYQIFLDNWDDFSNYNLKTRLIEDAVEKCMPFQVLPCDEPISYQAEVITRKCVYIRNTLKGMFLPNGEPTQDTVWIPVVHACPTGNSCTALYEMCLDYSTNPARLRLISLSCISFDPPGCPEQEPQLPPPGKSWGETWTTECFSKRCCPQP